MRTSGLDTRTSELASDVESPPKVSIKIERVHRSSTCAAFVDRLIFIAKSSTLMASSSKTPSAAGVSRPAIQPKPEIINLSNLPSGEFSPAPPIQSCLNGSGPVPTVPVSALYLEPNTLIQTALSELLKSREFSKADCTMIRLILSNPGAVPKHQGKVRVIRDGKTIEIEHEELKDGDQVSTEASTSFRTYVLDPLKNAGIATLNAGNVAREYITKNAGALLEYLKKFVPTIELSLFGSTFQFAGVDQKYISVVSALIEAFIDGFLMTLLIDAGLGLMYWTKLVTSRNMLYASMVAAISIIVKQFIHVILPKEPTHQSGFSSGDQETLMTSVVELVKVVFGGEIATDKPLLTKDRLFLVNQTFSAAKNATSMFTLIFSLIRYAINWLFEAAMGEPLFQNEAEKAAAKVRRIITALQGFIDTTSIPTPAMLTSVRVLRRDLSAALLEYQTIPESDPRFVAAVSKILETSIAYVSNNAQASELSSSRPQPVNILVSGPPGCGKGEFLQAAPIILGKALHWPGDPSEWVHLLENFDGFGSRPSPNAKFIVINEIFNSQDPKANERQAQYLLNSYSTTPLQSEGASLDAKDDYLRPVVQGFTANVMSLQKGVINQEALNRRLDAHFELSCSSPGEQFNPREEYPYPSLTFKTGNQTLTAPQVMAWLKATVEKKAETNTVLLQNRLAGAEKFAATFAEIEVPSFPRPESFSLKPRHQVRITESLRTDLKLDKLGYTLEEANARLANLGKRDEEANFQSLSTLAAHHGFKDFGDLCEEMFPPKDAVNAPVFAYIPAKKWTSDDSSNFVKSDSKVFISTLHDCVYVLNQSSQRFCVQHGLACSHPDDRSGEILQGTDVLRAIWAAGCRQYNTQNTIILSTLRGLFQSIKSLRETVTSWFYSLPTMAYAAFAVAAVGLALYNIVGPAIEKYRHQYYSETSSVQRSEKISIPTATFSQSPVLPAEHQSAVDRLTTVPAPDVSPMAQRLNTAKHNQRAVIGIRGTKAAHFDLIGLCGRIAATTLHSLDGITHFVLEAPQKIVFEFKQSGGLDEHNRTQVQWLPIPGRDAAFIVLPPGFMFRDMEKNLIHGTDIPVQQWSDTVLSYVRGGKVEFQLEPAPKIVSATDVEFVRQPYGSLQRYRNVVFTDGTTSQALVFSGGVECHDGYCGAAVIPSSFSGALCTSWWGMMHNGWFAPTSSATATVVTFEDLQALKSVFPWLHKSPSYKPTVTFKVNDTFTGSFEHHSTFAELPIPGFVQTKSKIRKSPIADTLVGMDLGQGVKMPSSQRVPALMRDLDRAMSKFSPSVPVPAEKDLQTFCEALDILSSTVLDAAKNAKVPRRFLTSSEAISGVPEFGIPGLDGKKSCGYVVGYETLQRKSEFWQELAPNVWDWKPEHKARAEEVFQTMLSGNVPIGFSKQSPKDEKRPLRNITEEEADYAPSCERRYQAGWHPAPGLIPKETRLTTCPDVYVTVASSRILSPITALLVAGAPLNWTMLGVDPNSYAGHVFWNALLSNNKEGIFLDIKRFDTNQGLTVCSAVDDHYMVPIGRALFSQEEPDVAERAVRAASATRYITYDLLGNKVYFHYQGMISGSTATTMGNNPVSSALVVGAAIEVCKAYGIPNRSHHIRTYLFGASQGDDMGFASPTVHLPLFNQDVADFGHRLGLDCTTASKDAVSAPLDAPLFLKRVPHRMRNGLYASLLTPDGIADQYSWVAVGSNTLLESASINAEQALRELFRYGRTVFEEAKTRLNNALFTARAQTIDLTYDELDTARAKAYGESVVPIQGPMFDVRHQSGVSQLTVPSTDKTATTVGGADSREQEAPPLVRTDGLTTFADQTLLLERTERPLGKIHSLANPFPRAEVLKALSRPYQIQTLTWSPGDPTGTQLAAYQFLSVMAAFPQLRNRLTGQHYLRSGIKLMIKMNTTSFNSGRLMVCFVPFCNDSADWRASYDSCSNAEHYLISASSSDSLSLSFPWKHPNHWMQLSDLAGDASLGTFVIFVEHPLQSASGTAPGTLSITVTAQLENPELAGPDTEAVIPPLMGVTKQSSLKEAAEKGKEGILTGVDLATSTVGGVVNSARNIVQPATSIVTDILGPIGGILKPFGQFAKDALGPIAKILPFFASRVTSIQTANQMVKRTFDNLTITDGDDKGQKMALSHKSLVSMDADIIGGDPMGDIHAALERPGHLEVGSISIAATQDTIITTIPVDPCYTLSKPVGTNFRFVMTPLAWECQKAALWRGGLRYAMFFSASKFVSAKVGVFFVPSTTSPSPSSDNYADVYGEVFDVVGDTVVGFTVPFLWHQSWKPTTEPLYSGIIPTGLLYVVLMNPISAAPGTTASPIYYTIYVAGDSDFQLAAPQRFCDKNLGNYKVQFSEVSAAFKKQSAIREIFAKPFPGLVSHSRGREENICVADELRTNVELMRRFENGIILTGLVAQKFWFGNYFFNLGYTNTGGDYEVAALRNHAFLALPYLIRRGAHRVKAYSPDSTGQLVFFSITSPNSNGTLAAGGAFSDIREVPHIEADVPYYNFVPYMGVDFHPSPKNSLPPSQQNEQFIVQSTGELGIVSMIFAVGDDFGLGMYHAPPSLVSDLPPPAIRSGVYSVKAVRAVKALGACNTTLDIHQLLHPGYVHPVHGVENLLRPQAKKLPPSGTGSVLAKH